MKMIGRGSGMLMLLGMIACTLILTCSTMPSATADTGDSDPQQLQNVSQEQARYTVIERSTADYAAVFVKDRKSQELITIMNSEKHGAFIAFYNESDSQRLASKPRLAICRDGLQITDRDGKTRFVDLSELANLDKGDQQAGSGGNFKTFDVKCGLED